MAAFTLVVMTVSSTYSPVPSVFGVPAQPTTDTSAKARKNAERYLPICFMVDSPEVGEAGLPASLLPSLRNVRLAAEARAVGAVAHIRAAVGAPGRRRCRFRRGE